MSICVPKGFLLAGVHCRIKRDPQKQDLTLVMSEEPASGTGVYTQNLVCAAPVEWDRSHTPSGKIQAVVICSGVANTYAGKRGHEDARRMAGLAAAPCGDILGPGPGALHRRNRGVLAHGKIEQGISAAAVKNGPERGLPDWPPRHVDH